MNLKRKPSSIVVVEFDEYKLIRDGDLIQLEKLISVPNYPINKTRWSGWTLLHRAAECGKVDACKLLIKYGANLHSKTTWGWHTPLHLALANGQVETAIYLTLCGADSFAKNKAKQIPTAYAHQRGFQNSVLEYNTVMLKRQFSKED